MTEGPAADELAAIIAAYAAFTARSDAEPPRAEPSRWALAGRLQLDDPAPARFVARAASRWNAAGRVDG